MWFTYNGYTMSSFESQLMQGLEFLIDRGIAEKDDYGFGITEKFNEYVLSLLNEGKGDYLDQVINVNDPIQISKFATRAMYSFIELAPENFHMDALLALASILKLAFKNAYDEKQQLSKLDLTSHKISWDG